MITPRTISRLLWAAVILSIVHLAWCIHYRVNYVTVRPENVQSATVTNPPTNWKCPHHNNPWHEVTENCPDYEK